MGCHLVVGVADPVEAAYSCPVVEVDARAVDPYPVVGVEYSLEILHILLLQSFYHFVYFKTNSGMVWKYKKLLNIMEKFFYTL